MDIRGRARKRYAEVFARSRREGTRRIDEAVLDEASRLIREEGDFEKAVERISAQPNVELDPLALKTRGTALTHLRRFEEAHRDQDAALALLRHEASAVLSTKAAILIEQGFLDDAVSCARQARQEDAAWYLPWVNETCAHICKRDLESAWLTLDEMVSAWPACLFDQRLAWHMYKDGIFAALRAEPGFRERVIQYSTLLEDDLGGGNE